VKMKMGEESSELLEEDFQKIGRVLKTFGADGQLRCQVAHEYRGLLLKDRFVWVQIDGIKVPFQIDRIQSKNKPLIVFADVDSEKKALHLTNSTIFVKTGDYDDLDLGISDNGMSAHFAGLIGYQAVIEGLERRATIEDVQIFPGQEMAFLNFTGVEEPTLVPLVPEFIVKIDDESRSVIFRLPEGITDL